MKRCLPTACLALAFAAVQVPTAFAQQARSALSGVVLDPGGLPLPGVAVTARNVATGITRDTVTVETGRYVFNSMAPGVYDVTFALAAFKTLRREGVELLVGQEITLNVGLDLGGVEETVTVTGETPMLDLKSKELGGNVTGDDFTTLPTQNRSFVMFASLLPGVVPAPDTQSTRLGFALHQRSGRQQQRVLRRRGRQ